MAALILLQIAARRVRHAEVDNERRVDVSLDIDLQEFKTCLQSDLAAGLRLSRQDINTLLTEVDADGNGIVDYEVIQCTSVL
jgi:EF-hand domain pair